MITRANLRSISVSKDTFVTLFLILTLLLIFMPLMAAFNDLLTRAVINLKGYAFIRDYIVPAEVRMVAVVLAAAGFDVSVTREYVVLGQTQTQPFISAGRLARLRPRNGAPLIYQSCLRQLLILQKLSGIVLVGRVYFFCNHCFYWFARG